MISNLEEWYKVSIVDLYYFLKRDLRRSAQKADYSNNNLGQMHFMVDKIERNF